MATVTDSGVVTKNNLISQSYANIYNLLNNRSNVPDPLDTSGARKLVYSRLPDVSGLNFSGYPIIVIKRATLDDPLEERSVDKTRGKIFWEFEIEVRSSDNILNHASNGASYCEQIMDNILKTINDITNRKALLCYGMANGIPFIEDFDSIELNSDPVFFAKMSLRYNKRMTLS